MTFVFMDATGCNKKDNEEPATEEIIKETPDMPDAGDNIQEINGGYELYDVNKAADNYKNEIKQEDIKDEGKTAVSGNRYPGVVSENEPGYFDNAYDQSQFEGMIDVITEQLSR